jgi:hypothetical protein
MESEFALSRSEIRDFLGCLADATLPGKRA